MQTAAAARKRKTERPDLYCPHPRCLWLVVHADGRVTPCPKHQPQRLRQNLEAFARERNT